MERTIHKRARWHKWLLIFAGLSIYLLVEEVKAIAVTDFKETKDIGLADFLTGRFAPQKANEFMRIGAPYASRPLYLRKDTFRAFKKMQAAALRDGVRLVIVSGFRSYAEQRRIWDRHYKRVGLSEPDAGARVKKILHYSSPPGFSRHHWGCEIDINSVSPSYFYTETGKKVAEWLAVNAQRFDFYLTYSSGRVRGFKSEPWQYTYYPTASKMMIFFRLYISAVNLDGFMGSHAVDVADILDEYIFAINPQILKRMQLEGKVVY